MNFIAVAKGTGTDYKGTEIAKLLNMTQNANDNIHISYINLDTIMKYDFEPAIFGPNESDEGMRCIKQAQGEITFINNKVSRIEGQFALEIAHILLEGE